MKKYVASVAIFCYEKDKVVVESFLTDTTDNWKGMLMLHSEFKVEISSGNNLKWLSDNLEIAKKQLDNNDLKIDICYTYLGESDV